MVGWRPKAGQPLTDKDRLVLYLFSQGYSIKQVARRIGVHEVTIRQRSAAIRIKLDARTTAEAVAQAIWSGQIGRDRDCGTPAAYHRHLRRGVPSDPACLIRRATDARKYRADHGSGQGIERKSRNADCVPPPENH